MFVELPLSTLHGAPAGRIAIAVSNAKFSDVRTRDKSIVMSLDLTHMDGEIERILLAVGANGEMYHKKLTNRFIESIRYLTNDPETLLTKDEWRKMLGTGSIYCPLERVFKSY